MDFEVLSLKAAIRATILTLKRSRTSLGAPVNAKASPSLLNGITLGGMVNAHDTQKIRALLYCKIRTKYVVYVLALAVLTFAVFSAFFLRRNARQLRPDAGFRLQGVSESTIVKFPSDNRSGRARARRNANH